MIPQALAVNGAIELFSRLKETVKKQSQVNQAASSSLIDVAASARVEPILLLDQDCAHISEITDIMQAMHSLFSGYYMQALNMVGRIGSATIGDKLAPFNPNRAAFESLSNVFKSKAQTSNMKHRLPLSSHAYVAALEEAQVAATAKEEKPLPSKQSNQNMQDVKDNNKRAIKAELDVGDLNKIQEAAPLCIGRMINVEIREENNVARVPVAIRLLVNVVPSDILASIFTFRDNFDMDMKERWHAFRAGRLSFWKDLVLCNDLIDKYRRAAINDKTGVTNAILNRESKNVFASMTSRTPSLATMSNLCVMSELTLELIEQQLNGKFDNQKVRESVFENTNLMILAVVEKRWERVSFYHRGLDMPTQLSFKQIKAANKSGSTDITDIMKSYMLGNPTL